MKRWFVAAVVVSLLFGGMAWAEEKFVPAIPCPKTKMVNSCLECHMKGNFRVKETAPDAHLNYPNKNMSIRGFDSGNLWGFYLLKDISHEEVGAFFDYLREKKIQKAVLEIYSPGGSLFGAQRILSLIQRFRADGGVVETRVSGFAASAGFLVFVAGDKGMRFVCPQADLMWHELISLKGIGWVFETPSDSEESARILRHLQNIRNEWLASRGNLTKKEIDDLIRKKEFWMSGKQAVEYGFADGFLGK